MSWLSQWGTGSAKPQRFAAPYRKEKGNTMKIKILGMALLALAATSAFAATNASGVADGHFYHHAVGEKAAITAHDGSTTAHKLEFTRLTPGTHNTTGESITCKTSEYTGHVTTRKVTVIQLFPTYTDCKTANGVYGEVTVDPEHCSYTFFSQGARKHGTVIVDCPAGQSIKIKHPNCEITVPAQTTAETLTEGISYTNLADGTITAHVTVNTITGHHHAGACIFLGTSHKFEMKGSVTVEGFEYKEGEGTTHTLVHGAAAKITST